MCMARPTKSVSQIRVPTPGKGGRGGEGRESSGSMLTIQIFGHLRT